VPSPVVPIVAKLTYIGVLLLMMAAGTANMAFKLVGDAPVSGVEFSAATPTLTVSHVRDETFQRDFVAWFEQHWGLRGFGVRVDSTLGFKGFGETRSDSHAVVGAHDVLFTRDDISYSNRCDTPDETVLLAKRFVRVQAKLREREIVLLPILIPSKTSFYADAIPTRWRLRGCHRRSDQNIYGAFVRTLSDSGATFLDARAFLEAHRKRPDDVFEPTGRHWRASVACHVLQAALDEVRPRLPEMGAERIDCRSEPEADPSVEVEDYDIYRLLNTWGPKPTNIAVDRMTGQKAGEALRIPTLFVGSSFVWKFAHLSRDFDVLQPSLVYFYDATVMVTKTNEMRKVEPYTEAWRRETFGKRLVIVAVLETFLPDDGKKFIGELEQELDLREPAQNLK
jgi:hypothetical protein